MTLLDKLQAHRGGLLRLKNQLYWYSGVGWDNNPGRVCLLLDATCPGAATCPAAAEAAGARGTRGTPTAAFLLIDGQPHWVWIAEEDVELLVNDPPAN